MTSDKNRRNLLKAATALGLSIGISASNIVSAASHDNYIKFDGISATHLSQGGWVDGRIMGGRLYLKGMNGKSMPAKQGTYHLRDGSVVTVSNGKVISFRKGLRRAPIIHIKNNRYPGSTRMKMPLKGLK